MLCEHSLRTCPSMMELSPWKPYKMGILNAPGFLFGSRPLECQGMVPPPFLEAFISSQPSSRVPRMSMNVVIWPWHGCKVGLVGLSAGFSFLFPIAFKRPTGSLLWITGKAVTFAFLELCVDIAVIACWPTVCDPDPDAPVRFCLRSASVCLKSI